MADGRLIRQVWLAAENKHEIAVFYLPGYSPEPIPDEMANADLEQAASKPAPGCTKLQLVDATSWHLQNAQ